MQQTSTKGVQDQAQLSGKGDSLGIERGIKIWPYLQIVYAQIRIFPGMNKILWDFQLQMDPLMQVRRSLGGGSTGWIKMVAAGRHYIWRPGCVVPRKRENPVFVIRKFYNHITPTSERSTPKMTIPFIIIHTVLLSEWLIKLRATPKMNGRQW